MIRIKDIDRFFVINKIHLKDAILRTNKLFTMKSKFVVPLILINFVIMIIFSRFIAYNYIRSYHVSWIDITFLVILLVLWVYLFSLLISLEISKSNVETSTKELIILMFKKLFPTIWTSILGILRILPSLVLTAVGLIIFILIFDATGLSPHIIFRLIIIGIITISIYYNFLKILFIIPNIILFKVKGFTAINLSMKMFSVNKKNVIGYSFIFMFLPSLINYFLVNRIDNYFLSILYACILLLIYSFSIMLQTVMVKMYIEDVRTYFEVD